LRPAQAISTCDSVPTPSVGEGTPDYR
jgi:hypothetical protein